MSLFCNSHIVNTVVKYCLPVYSWLEVMCNMENDLKYPFTGYLIALKPSGSAEAAKRFELTMAFIEVHDGSIRRFVQLPNSITNYSIR